MRVLFWSKIYCNNALVKDLSYHIILVFFGPRFIYIIWSKIYTILILIKKVKKNKLLFVYENSYTTVRSCNTPFPTLEKEVLYLKINKMLLVF
jgi:hypothetical protein